MEELISVIVPVYNIEPYLERCIDSIIKQTYRKLEIILVDDGSTDQSGTICDAYEQKDDRVFVIHKKNGGLSSARNSGLKKATGGYIGFVDGDDFISEDMYETLIHFMKENIDITCCGRTYILPKQKRREYCLSTAIKFSRLEAMEEMILSRRLSPSACTKLFRKDLFEQIQFPEGRICEDIITVYQLIKKSRNVVHTGQAKYFYCYRENSISHKAFYPQRMDYVLFMKWIYVDVCKNYPRISLQAEAGYIVSLINMMENIQQSNLKSAYDDIRKRLKKVIGKLAVCGICNPYISKKMKKKIIRSILGMNIGG